MSCNLAIHNELKKEYCVCPFCDKTVDEVRSVLYDCCENPGLIDDGHILCKNCGPVMETELRTSLWFVYRRTERSSVDSSTRKQCALACKHFS